MLAYPERFRGKRVGLVLSGGNIDTRILASVLMRQLARSRRIAQFKLRVKDSPGALARVTALVAELEANILEISHHRTFAPVSIKETGLDMTVETRDAEHTQKVLRGISAAGYAVELVEQA